MYSSLKDNTWAADLADMQLMNKFNKEIRFLFYISGIYSKFAWVIPLKQKESGIIVIAFQKLLDDSKRKPNKIWVDEVSKFYNRSMKSLLK